MGKENLPPQRRGVCILSEVTSSSLSGGLQILDWQVFLTQSNVLARVLGTWDLNWYHFSRKIFRGFTNLMTISFLDLQMGQQSLRLQLLRKVGIRIRRIKRQRYLWECEFWNGLLFSWNGTFCQQWDLAPCNFRQTDGTNFLRLSSQLHVDQVSDNTWICKKLL